MAVPKKKKSQRLSKSKKTTFLINKIQKSTKYSLPFLKIFFFNRKKTS